MRGKKGRKLLSLFMALCIMLSLITVATPAASALNSFSIASGMKAVSDDSEEWVSSGLLDYNSSDLEIGWEKPTSTDQKAQIVALRFAELNIPKNAIITSAYIQFTGDVDDDVSTKCTNPFDISIHVENTANSAPIQDAQYNISNRTYVVSPAVRWYSISDADKWTTSREAGPKQQTPDLKDLVQTVVDKSDWALGNAMCFLLTGTGNRTAASSEDSTDLSTGPVLHVTFDYSGVLTQSPPTGLTGTAPTSTSNNDGKISGTTAAMEYRLAGAPSWTRCSGTTVTGLPAGSYEVRYAASSGYDASNPATVTVPPYVPVGYVMKDLTLQPGKNAGEMNFCWYASGASAAQVQVAPKSAMTGSDFPASAAATFTGTAAASGSFMSNKATVTGLNPATEYVYRVGDGSRFSDIYSFKTHDTSSYNVILAGDPQIGSSGNEAKDTAGWVYTVRAAITTYPNTSFILSAGDQVETSTAESQYDGFFSPQELTSVPLAPTIGNHDNGSLYGYHYNAPNESTTYGTTAAGGDYWFTYGNTLYMVLNSNNQSAATHDAFISRAISAAGSGITWRVVMFHHSIYSSASHSTDTDILSRRSDLYPIFDKYDIDVVLSGHDHCYTRSYQMEGGVAQNGLQSAVTNPAGTLYITADSSSGSKYYDFKSADTAYTAYRWQGYAPTYSNIQVTNNSFTVSTYVYNVSSPVDIYTITKDPSSAPSGLGGTAPTSWANNDGQLTETTTDMEYKLSTAAAWSACANTATAGLAPGTYDVRYKAGTHGADAGVPVVVIIPAYNYPAKDVTLQPGGNATKMNFCWYSDSSPTAAKVQVVKKTELAGNSFPLSAPTYTGTVAASGSNTSSEVTVTGLEANTEYAYRYGDGTSYSSVRTFKTHSTSSYNAILVGDPQIGCSDITTDTAGWQNTLTKALNNFGNTSFILSAGDQVETNSSEAQYDGFFSPAELLSTPLVPTIGNHDDGTLYKYHYNSPNESSTYGADAAGGDYWFTYGNTLYMVLNSNNQSATSHDAFIQQAIGAAGSGIVWKVVMFHHSIYSSANHSTDSDILSRRSDLYPLFDKYDIDVVLSGHDHCYTRSYQMLGGVAQTSQSVDAQGRVVNPTGTLYITADSASGSKYYDFKSADTAYAAYRWQGKVPSYSNVTVTGDTLTITTYRSDNDGIIDTYAIYKGGALQDQAAPAGLTGVTPTTSANNDGKITGTTAAMEYKMTTATAWTACAGAAVTGLVPGSYSVRYAAKAGFNASPAATVVVQSYGYTVKDLTLQPGADATRMNFCWYSDSNVTASCVQIALKSAMTGSTFPASAAVSFNGTVAIPVNNTANKSNEVTVTGLTPSTEYVYRVGDGTAFGPVCSFKTHDTASYNAILVGDPQIGSSGNETNDATGWRNTVSKALTTFGSTSFILSAGDQVETNTAESQYDGFFSPAELTSMPLIPTIGNHDNGALYKYHYNSPNESATNGATAAGGDYWFTYGSTLYMVLNSNNQSAATHDDFIRQAIAGAGPSIAWKVVMFHHSIYSSATHSDSDILSRRGDLYPIFDKYDIDVVLSGHDHCYTRSYQMLGGVPQTSQSVDARGRVVNPSGTLYITADSGSGSKYYDFKSADTAYSAFRWQGYVPSYSNVIVTGNTFTVTTYRTDTNAVIDTYTIYKGSALQDQAAPSGLGGVAPTTFGGNDGKITGTTAAMEYKLSSAATWTACTGTTVAGLVSGTYNVRYAATSSLNAGPSADVVIPSGLTLTIGAEAAGGTGYKRTVTASNAPSDLGTTYYVVQLTDGSGANAKVSVLSMSAKDEEITVSYTTAGTKLKVWAVSGLPNLVSGNMGVTVYAYSSV